MDRENFIEAFNTNCGGCRRQCDCGREFYDDVNSYSWEEGELEELEANPRATAVDYTVEMIGFEGKEFAVDCSCWHTRAERIMHFIDSHAYHIAQYLRLEKKRLQRIADNAPVVEETETA